MLLNFTFILVFLVTGLRIASHGGTAHARLVANRSKTPEGDCRHINHWSTPYKASIILTYEQSMSNIWMTYAERTPT